jgi:hypothetical protein
MTKTKQVQIKKRSRPGSLGELYDLMDSAFHLHRTRLGNLNVRELSEDLEVSVQAMYRWFQAERLPAKQVRKVVELSKGRLTLEKLAPFSL